jgi:hypothetical protein
LRYMQLKPDVVFNVEIYRSLSSNIARGIDIVVRK